MAPKNNSFERFWKELKRRKVFSVVTTYAATAYIIIEVTNNLIEPLSLPAWIAKLVIILLGSGLPVVVILSWIFDFTLQGIKKTESLEELAGKKIEAIPLKRKLRASYVLNAILIIAVLVLAYPKIFKRDTLEMLRSSGERIAVVVIPFQNMTNDSTLDFWQNGIQDNIITYLSNYSEELIVRQQESINNLIKSKGLTNYAKITASVASAISQKLDANVFISGSLKPNGVEVRLSVQLVDATSEEVFKSFQINGTPKEILHISDSLSTMVKNFLIISKLEKEVSQEIQKEAYTNSPDAYRYFTNGRKSFYLGDYATANDWFLKAIAVDSNFTMAAVYISVSYANQGLYEQGKKWCIKVYEKKDSLPLLFNYTQVCPK